MSYFIIIQYSLATIHIVDHARYHHSHHTYSCCYYSIQYSYASCFTLVNWFSIQSLLGEIEGFELFAARALATVNQTEKFLFAGICIAILFNELFNGQITTSNSDNNLVLFNFHKDSLFTILVDALRFSLELHMISEFNWSIVDVFSKSSVNWIVFDWMVDKDIRWHVLCIGLQLVNHILKMLNFQFSLFKLLE